MIPFRCADHRQNPGLDRVRQRVQVATISSRSGGKTALKSLEVSPRFWLGTKPGTSPFSVLPSLMQ